MGSGLGALTRHFILILTPSPKKSLGVDGIKKNVDYRTENIPLLEIIQNTRIKCLQSKRDGLTMVDKEIYNKCVQKAEGVLVLGG